MMRLIRSPRSIVVEVQHEILAAGSLVSQGYPSG